MKKKNNVSIIAVLLLLVGIGAVYSARGKKGVTPSQDMVSMTKKSYSKKGMMAKKPTKPTPTKRVLIQD